MDPTHIERIACNYSVDTKSASSGSLAYIVMPNGGNLHNRVRILSRSRSGRWIRRWERLAALTDFRRKRIPEQSPIFQKLLDACDVSALSSIRKAATSMQLGHRTGEKNEGGQ